jgi:glyoxylase-like metal-dependent hydrolase (beta-lactamase superfamily II)
VYCLGPWGRTQTNAYLMRAGSTSALVDAGWERDAARIEANARVLLGLDVTPSAILLTHDHPDHAGSARVLAETWRCPILLHSAELPIAIGDFDRRRGPVGGNHDVGTAGVHGHRLRGQPLRRVHRG